MNSEVIEIKCRWIGYIPEHIMNDQSVAEFPIDNKLVRIIFYTIFGKRSINWKKDDIDVSVICCRILSSKQFIDKVKERVSLIKKRNRTSLIFIVGCHGEWKSTPNGRKGYFDLSPFKLNRQKFAELNGDKLMNKKLGKQLANEIGAVKYLEYSKEYGQIYKDDKVRWKIIYDEIAFAYLGKIKDEKEERDRIEKKLKDQELIEKQKEREINTKRNVLILYSMFFLIGSFILRSYISRSN